MTVGSVVILGIGSVYVATVRVESQNFSQSALQRQGALVLEELRRQIVDNGATTLTRGSCKAGNADSLGVTNSAGGVTSNFCFYRSGNQLLEDRCPGGCTFNLLSGALVRVPLGATGLTTGLTVAGASVASCSGTNDRCRARITFTLSDNVPNVMTFTVDLMKRN